MLLHKFNNLYKSKWHWLSRSHTGATSELSARISVNTVIVSQPFPLQNHYTYNTHLVGLSTLKMKNVSLSSRKTIDWNLIILWIPVDLKRNKPITRLIISLITKIWRSNTGCYFRKLYSRWVVKALALDWWDGAYLVKA